MPTKSEASLVSSDAGLSCTLNTTYTKSLKGSRFRWARYMTEDSWYRYRKYLLRDLKTKNNIPVHTGQVSCCGITELEFNGEGLDAYIDDKDWKELIAKYIKYSLEGLKDERILIVGLPIENTDDHDSGYNFEFYNKLFETLLQFGFKQVGTKYINQNSKNKLVVLVGQQRK